jgi:hypothetical protein
MSNWYDMLIQHKLQKWCKDCFNDEEMAAELCVMVNWELDKLKKRLGVNKEAHNANLSEETESKH